MLEFLIFFLMGMLIVALISFTCFLLRNAINSIRVNRFFAKNQPQRGIVEGKEMVEENFSTMATPIFMGSSVIYTPHMLYTPKEYYIELSCLLPNNYFRATYQVPAEDYERAKTGQFIEIEDSWKPAGFEVMALPTSWWMTTEE